MDQQKKEPSKTLIYVSNLPFDTNDEQFRDLFKGFSIKTAYVARRKNGKSKGFGFVNLEKESEQNAAIEKVNGKELNSRKLIARIAFNDERRNEKGELKEEFKTQQTNQVASETVVYVSNLAWSVNNEELKKIFSEFNPKVVTVATRRNGRSKGFGFVEFNNKEDREKALSLDQKSFHERTITVKPSTGYRGDNQDNNNQNRNDRRNNNRNRNNNNNRNRNRSRENRNRSPTKRSPSGNNNNNNNNNNRSDYTIYIKNLPFELDETDLKDVFSEFNPTSANIPRRYGKSKGYGFVEFRNSKDQNDALRALDQSEINGRVVSISISNNRGNSPRRNNNRSPRRNNNNNRSRERRNNNRSRERRNNNNNRSSRRRGSRERRNNNNNRNERSNVSSQPSTTNVYVSNIPFTIDEQKLGEFFKDYKVSKLTIPRKRNGRSFGYAFIEFASNEEQQRALKLNDSQIEGRKIVVQAAFQRDNNTSTPTTTNNNNTQSK